MNVAPASLAIRATTPNHRWVDTTGHRRGSLLVVDDEPTITEVLSR
jgi:hypothetical protein